MHYNVAIAERSWLGSLEHQATGDSDDERRICDSVRHSQDDHQTLVDQSNPAKTIYKQKDRKTEIRK